MLMDPMSATKKKKETEILNKFLVTQLLDTFTVFLCATEIYVTYTHMVKYMCNNLQSCFFSWGMSSQFKNIVVGPGI